jgi:SNF2 family DNA or RNA helicase
MKPLFDHQVKAIEFLQQRRYIGGLYWEMGCGKCRAVIEAFKALRMQDRSVKMVVVAPLSILEAGWGADIKEFSDFTYFNAHGVNGKSSLVPDQLKEDILLINFEGMLQKKNTHITKHIRTNLLVIDESSRMKNHKTATTKTLLSWRSLPKYKIIMSGTPAPNSPMEYWAQIEFLQEWALHKSFFGFRNTYFHLQRGSQTMQIQRGAVMSKQVMREILSKGWKYEITPENLKLLMQRINPIVSWAKKAECLDLPDQVDEIRLIEMGPAQARNYKDMVHDLITEIRGNAVTAQVALAKVMKLREITSGFAIDAGGVEQSIGVSGSTECPKIGELEDLLDEIGDQQVIIWACFKWDIRRIVSFLEEKYGPGCAVTLYSDTKDHLASIQDFQRGSSSTSKVRFLVANPHSAAHGLTFVNCSMQVFFSLDYSYEYYEQAKARTHRAGQVNKCTYVHLLARGTIDEDILKCLKGKGDMNQIAYNLVKKC